MTEPRIMYDQPDPEYRAVDAASYSALKHMLDSPARYLWERHNRVEKTAYDKGHAVHGIVLGVGEPVHVIDAPDWKQKATREERDAAYAAGEVPLLAHEWDAAQRCADRITTHPLAGPILTRPGDSEVSIYWTDDPTGLACKARADRVTVTPDGTHYIVDVKTSGQTANPAAFGRAAANFGYHMQAAYYMHGYATAAGLEPDQVAWLNVIAEVNAPHEVAVTTFDWLSLNAGENRWRHALDQLAACQETNEWPGYTPAEAAIVTIPQYALKETWQ